MHRIKDIAEAATESTLSIPTYSHLKANVLQNTYYVSVLVAAANNFISTIFLMPRIRMATIYPLFESTRVVYAKWYSYTYIESQFA